MEKKSFLKVRLFFNFIKFTILLTLTVNSFAQNNLKGNSYTPISDSKTERSIFDRPRIAGLKSDKEVSKIVEAVKFSTEFEQAAFKQINKIRQENGLNALEWSKDMAKVARLHSENMAKYKFFAHQGQDGLNVNDRADSFGFYNWIALGENIAFNRGYENPVEKACDSWMKSPGHRDNMLNKRWKEAAIGVTIAGDGTVYFTNVFMVR